MDEVSKLLSNDFFEKPLRSYLKDDSVKVIKCESKGAIPVGENYTSEIYRTTITYTTEKSENQKTISTIVKCYPNNEMMLGLAKEYRLFEIEAAMYNNILLVVNNTLGAIEQISAKCIHYEKEREQKQIIVFEDLSVLNFKMHPRREGLDLQHCLLVVEKLAYLHAVSLSLLEKDCSIITKCTGDGVFKDTSFTTNWVATGFNELIEACSKWPGYEKYAVKLEKIKDKAIQRIEDSKFKSDFNVLNHGDPWINNMMFSYDSEGKLKDMRLLDFQLSIYASPNLDLMYFWATSPNIEVRMNHFDKFYSHYYEKLTSVLTELDYCLDSLPSKEQLLQDFHSRSFYGLIAAVTVLPIVGAANRDDASLEEMVHGNDGFRHESYNNERFRRYMEYLLPYFDKQGILD